MKVLPLRLLVALALSLGLGLLLVLVLYLTELGFAVWERLSGAPAWFWVVYLAALLLLAGGGGYVLWRVFTVGRARPARVPPPPPGEAELRSRVQAAEAAGLVPDEARRELDELSRRREAGQVVVALFGDISSGKSSLVRALLPGAEVETSPVGGTTREITHYRWHSPAGDELLLADLPGLNESGGTLDAAARAEALRAHLVLYVCDGDLTRDQFQALGALQALDKPLLVALNKTDRYDEQELEALRRRLDERLEGRAMVVGVQAGGQEEVTRVLPDGREETLLRDRPPRVKELRRALQQSIDRDPDALEQLRDAAVFLLTEERLAAAENAQRRERAEDIVRGYSRKAVFGALAAVGPGTDVLIQGYLGVAMVRELAKLYQVPVKELDLQRFLDQAAGYAKKELSLLLALAGNVFKAFPGVGTVVGGMLHAVAYGLIFEALGRAVTRALEARGELAPGPALKLFEDELHDDLETRARRLARLVAARQERAGSS